MFAPHLGSWRVPVMRMPPRSNDIRACEGSRNRACQTLAPQHRQRKNVSQQTSVLMQPCPVALARCCLKRSAGAAPVEKPVCKRFPSARLLRACKRSKKPETTSREPRSAFVSP